MNDNATKQQASDSTATLRAEAGGGSNEDWKQRAIWLHYELRKAATRRPLWRVQCAQEALSFLRIRCGSRGCRISLIWLFTT